MKGGETGKKLKHNKNIQEQKKGSMAQKTKLQKKTWMKCDLSKSKIKYASMSSQADIC